MMTRWISLFIVLLIFLILTVSVGVESKRSRKNKLKNEDGNKDCGKWIYSDCVPKNVTLGCGKGIKSATRNGTDCKNTKKTTNCTIKCNGHGKCTYGKMVFSECDATGLTVIGTKTLIKGDASCKQTLTITKKCRRNKRNDKKKKGSQRHVTKPDRHSKKSRVKQITRGE